MDGTVLALYASGLAATVAGSGLAAADVARRVKSYRRDLLDAEVHDAFAKLDRIHQHQLDQLPEMIALQVRQERAARVDAERRLAAVAGATSGLRRLWLFAAVALSGVLLSGTADLLATTRAR